MPPPPSGLISPKDGAATRI